MAANLLVTCPSCQAVFTLNINRRPAGAGQVEVGVECSLCHFWQHSYYTNPGLDERRAALQKYQADANKSEAHMQRYLRAKARYQQAHDAVQGRG